MGDRTFSWINPALGVKETKKYGKGVFSRRAILKNELLVVFGGYVMTRQEEVRLPVRIQDVAHQIAPNLVLGVRQASDLQPVDNINHNCNPNSGFKGQIFLVAMRNIKKGEEITFDYAMVLHKAPHVPPYILKCLCGSLLCRGTVTWNDWKKPALQKRYRGYFQWYLEEKIRRSKPRKGGRTL